MNRSGQRGFTIVELMVTITVGAILLTLAVPSFLEIIRNNRLTTEANILVASLQYARSEAVRRRGNVSLRPTNEDDWALGWEIWADARDINGDGDTIDAGEAELRLRVVEAFEGTNALTPTAGFTRITYLPNGFVRPADVGGFDLCHASGLTGRQITFAATGQVTTDGEYTCP